MTLAELQKKLLNASSVRDINLNDTANGFAELLNTSAAASTLSSSLSEQLEGYSASQLVQPPTLSYRASRPKKTVVAVATALATGVLLLLFVFARQAFRSANDAESARKLARIRQALGMKPAD